MKETHALNAERQFFNNQNNFLIASLIFHSFFASKFISSSSTISFIYGIHDYIKELKLTLELTLRFIVNYQQTHRLKNSFLIQF